MPFSKDLLVGASGNQGGADFYEYQIENSVFFDGTSSKLTKSFSTAATSDDKAGISVWIKRNGSDGTNSAIGSTTNTKIISGDAFNQLEINTNNPTGFSDQFGFFVSNGAGWLKQKLRDASAWYHIVFIYDSTNSTANSRVLVYLNGVNLPTNDSTKWNYTNSNSNPYPGLNEDITIKKNGLDTLIGAYVYDGAGYFGGSMAEFIVIDGAAEIDNFGEFKNGVWLPKDPTGLTFGNNGFHLKFTNASNFGEDFSGNNNDFTPAGFSSDHQSLDSPTNGVN